MKLILFDLNAALCAEWDNRFRAETGVEVLNISLEEMCDHDFDCLVSPANSFGLMDGGIDAEISRLFPAVQARVTEDIFYDYNGMQPVGTSFIVETGSKAHPYLAHTPTMRYPQRISSWVVFDAMRAALRAVHQFNAECDHIGDSNNIEILACPGLGTLSGGVTPEAGAAMMYGAWKFSKEPRKVENWEQARSALMYLYQPQMT
jgi:O-acetyl-ADP-ribose deacetylase (regulator of RNase III)